MTWFPLKAGLYFFLKQPHWEHPCPLPTKYKPVLSDLMSFSVGSRQSPREGFQAACSFILSSQQGRTLWKLRLTEDEVTQAEVGDQYR